MTQVLYHNWGNQRAVLFDIKKYETPSTKDVNMDRAKHNVGVFLSAYLSARCRVGQPHEPKATASYSLVPSFTANNIFEAERVLIDREGAQEEFEHLHELFIRGYSAIRHPHRPDVAERREKIFYDRYINGLSIYVTAQRNNTNEESVRLESNKIIIQFVSALELVAFKWPVFTLFMPFYYPLGFFFMPFLYQPATCSMMYYDSVERLGSRIDKIKYKGGNLPHRLAKLR